MPIVGFKLFTPQGCLAGSPCQAWGLQWDCVSAFPLGCGLFLVHPMCRSYSAFNFFSRESCSICSCIFGVSVWRGESRPFYLFIFNISNICFLNVCKKHVNSSVECHVILHLLQSLISSCPFSPSNFSIQLTSFIKQHSPPPHDPREKSSNWENIKSWREVLRLNYGNNWMG